ncbi:MAG TPA: hypothetical protein VMH89_09400 [Candidatus Acidoferrum sp.]|nr:hypothetical protein [Candidatus Acidoferrum sp.]
MSTTQSLEPTYFEQSHPLPPRNEAHSSGVSWAAVIAGAFVTAALSLILLALGAGAGLSSLSPWSNSGFSPSAVGFGALLFLAIVELISASIGGYLAGRLRTKWVDVHTDEVYFRDTAHGFLVWAVALVISAAFLTSAAGAMVGAEARNTNSSRSESLVTDANRYYIDSLFRTGQASATPSEAERTEVGLIFAHALGKRELAAEDRNYVTDRVAAVTGLSHPEAERRVADVFQQDQQAADAARKAAAHGLYWLFVAMLLGAFCASFAATLGGKQRDHIRTLAPVR